MIDYQQRADAFNLINGTEYTAETYEQDSQNPYTSVKAFDEGYTAGAASTADAILQDFEARGLQWSLDYIGTLREVRIWKWPEVIARARFDEYRPLADMLARVLAQIDLSQYPRK